MAQGLKVAVVGATGMVGAEMLRVLEERAFPVAELVPVASARSAGKTVTFNGAEHTVVEIAPEVFEGVDLALFSAGGGTSREWSPIAASKGALVVDNSSAFRADPECPLIVPEVNPDAAANRPKGIIANPNCSTIQLVVALKPLHDEARLKRVVVATYQAIKGHGELPGATEAKRPGQRYACPGDKLRMNVLRDDVAIAMRESGQWQLHELGVTFG